MAEHEDTPAGWAKRWLELDGQISLAETSLLNAQATVNNLRMTRIALESKLMERVGPNIGVRTFVVGDKVVLVRIGGGVSAHLKEE